MPKLKASFFYGFADNILHPVREKCLFGATVEEKKELGGTRFISKTCILCERLLETSGGMQVVKTKM
jgi:hypothetical protein